MVIANGISTGPGSGVCALLLAAVACAAPSDPHPAPGIDILEVSPPRFDGSDTHALNNACRGWTWTPSSVSGFFQLSEDYPEAPYARFYQIGCGVSGRLRAEGREWRFEINGSGMAAWTTGSRDPPLRMFSTGLRGIPASPE